MIFFWGMCRCTICHCPNVTRNENHLCGACFHPDSVDDDHQGLNQITLTSMRKDFKIVDETIYQKLLKIVERLSNP